MPLNERQQNFLKDTLPFWAALTAEQRLAVVDGSDERRFSTGDMLHRGPVDCAGLYVIESGQVRAYSISETGREITLFRLFERDVCIFSASCVMKDIRFSIYMQAAEPTRYHSDSDAGFPAAEQGVGGSRQLYEQYFIFPLFRRHVAFRADAFYADG